ncbi:integrase core domain-containing protein [Hirsutella rhossiliensis]|uniref:Integrase core domain-containing protein n=1 Tax=Hirsutella rhossiliensis TaxID=111463 RepID=A0A9P8SEE0_9HYPO|nr:integrase core domain-containing protein [Hirsutella rhossiliensis]KAH0958879.1 integrase core domain-containing protein [Hirsutella rhossiliensis]
MSREELFLGFANYYRIFIPDYAKITQSLDALLKKGTAFHWGRAENEAFQELKRRFCESPVLKQWDPSLPTFLETDCSGYALGGVLSQEGPDGRRHACAFFSKRLSPAEYNYPIHDKEMLAIMRCLDNWNAELRSCGPFTILTDHRNLEHTSGASRKGFLKPLPIPDRPRSHLSMDFITDLPPTGPSKARYLWVIVDRLTKAVTLEVMDNMEAEQCANRFLQCHYRFHGMPRSIVSDRGSNWLSRFWKRFCRLAGVTQKLSTAYHPQTDGGPERMNQEIEAYLRAYVSYVQDD